MKKLALIAVIFGLLGFGSVHAQEFTLKSDDLSGQLTMTQVFSGFGCTGKNISPSLEWMNAPKDTKSFAFTVYDPDAPTGSGWWHWVVFDIPSDTNELKTDAGSLQKGLAPKGSVQSVRILECLVSAEPVLPRATNPIGTYSRYMLLKLKNWV